MLTLALIGAALAAPPDAAPALVGGWAGAVTNLAASADGRLVTGINGSSVVLLSTDDWSGAQAAPCNASAAAPALTGSSVIDVWVACDDGAVRRLFWDDGEVVEDDLSFPMGAGDPLVGVWMYDADGTIWTVAAAGDTSQALVYSLDPATGSTTEYPTAYTGYEDAELVGDLLYVAHGGSELSRVLLSSGLVTPSLANFSSVNVSDVAASPLASVYGVDSSGYLAEFDPDVLGWTIWKSGLDAPRAVGTSLATADSWVLVAGDDAAEVWRIQDNAIATDRYTTFGLQAPVSDVVVGGDGYAFGASEGGILVLTANPWIDAVSASPTSGTTGTAVTVTFTPQSDVSWALRLGGDRTGSGALLASGSADGGEVVTVPVEIADDWAEGRNALFVVATDDEGDEGHAAASVLVDNPPGAPALSAADLGFGDGSLILAFDGISDEDLARYDVYVSDAPFDPADWPVGAAGGPAGPAGLEVPIAAPASGGERVSVTISPLTNDQTYYVAVRAVDAGGLEGPMSDVIEGTPRQTFGAAELAGEQGGSGCATGAIGASGWLAGLGLLAIRRRRVAAVGLGLALSGAAFAQDRDDDGPNRDLTPAYGDFEVRYGAIQLEDSNIEAVYGDSGNNILQIEFGPQLWRFFEVDLGLGFFQELDFTVAEDGAPSDERTMMTWFPVAIDGTLRGHLLDEQILVPHVRAGLDYVIWREEWDDGGGGKDNISGAKRGWHYGVGAGLLLDGLGKRRASLLEAQTGINDTYLIAEWRRQNVTGDSGLDFSGRMITVGLKLDY